MLQGGFYDQLAGGFHRYSTDEQWLIPHFEKMLYNQAQLARVYTSAWCLCGEPEFARIAKETLDYVLRELQSEDGLFFAASDADSEGREGKFYAWPYAELCQHLDKQQLSLLERVYGVTEAGNFEGSNILHLPQTIDHIAAQLKRSPDQLQQQLSDIKTLLYDIRQQRPPPLRDDKIITEWNGMMITALAEAGQLMNNPHYIASARRAAKRIYQCSRDPQGQRKRSIDPI